MTYPVGPWTPETEALLAVDVDAAITAAQARPLPPPEVLAAARKRNRVAAFRYMHDAARRGVTSDDPKSETLLEGFRRDVLREAGVDERLVRLLVPSEAR